MGVMRDESGQMSVELAVLMPVALALLVVVVDLMVFIGDCARFDRVSAEMVRINVASPSSDAYGRDASSSIQQGISAAMGDPDRLDIQVSYQGKLYSGTEEGSLISMLPQPQCYRCSMTYHPWPFNVGFAGFAALSIQHHRDFVMDSYRPGILI